MSQGTIDALLARLGGAVRVSDIFAGNTSKDASEGGGVLLTRAPGRLDVMGGIADYSGSRVCQMTLAAATAVAIAPRSDGQIVCRSAQVGKTVELPLAALGVADPLAVRGLFGEENHWARYPIGCLWWLLRHRPPAGAGPRQGLDGLSLLIDSDVPLGGGVSSSAAIEVATMTGLTRLLGVEMGGLELAAACQAVENHVVGAPCGVMDQVACCLGRAGAMLEILCQPGPDGLPAQVAGDVAIPPGVKFIGVHSGVRHEVRGDPYTDTRVAAFMAQKILSASVGGAPLQLDPTRGWLANLSPGEYQSAYRGALPEIMTGKKFVDRYGSTNDSATQVDPRPGEEYYVRAAADHHVMEMDRVTRFVGLMRARGDLEPRLMAAGELMNQSHQSYSVNARLGHEHTDLLARMLRAPGTTPGTAPGTIPGTSKGFYGAKITGGGGGGTVAVLMRDTPAGDARVEEVRAAYERQTGRKTMLLAGSSPGAAHSPSVTVRLEEGR